MPKGVNAVTDFQVNQYLGTWFEIARLDHGFERNLEQVTATYSLKDNGMVKVLNKGFNSEKLLWQEATGKAKFAGERDRGHLEVSFFGPFYGDYIIFELDENYQYAFVTSGENYLWLLSRTPVVSDDIKDKFLTMTKHLGFDTQALIFVKQE